MNPEYPRPADLKLCRRGAEWAACVAAANEVGLFAALAERSRSPSSLAERLELDRRALEILVGALDALGLVRLDSGRVELTEEGRARYADPDSDLYEGVASRRWRDGIRDYLRLDEALRSGGPIDPESRGGEDDQEWLATFMAAMAGKPPAQVGRLIDACLRRRRDARTVLDLGGGPGVHSRAFVARGLRTTLFDRPETIAFVAERYGLSEIPEIELVAGDFLETLPEGLYDIVLLSNITHIYAPATNRSLIERLAALQPAGGVLAIMDFVRGLSPFAPLFAVTMLLKTESGNTYALDDYRSWLTAAGYAELETEDVDEERQLITALRR